MNARSSGRPSLADIAAEAGVSTSQASRILSRHPGLRAKPETQERVRAVAERLGYQPHRGARALRMSRVGTIGLVVHDVTNPIHAEIIRGAQGALTEQGHALLLADAEELARNPDTFTEILGPGRMDGLIWHASGESYDAAMITRAAATMPTLLINSTSQVGVPALHLDDTGAARLAVDHLIGLGHRRIGFLGGAPHSDLTRRRYAGYLDALQQHGVPNDDRLVCSDAWDADSGGRQMAELLSLAEPPTAVFVANIIVATGALAAARSRGVSVPTELSMITLHDAWFAALASPAITTVRLPLRELGRQSVTRIQQLASESAAADAPATRTTMINDPAPYLVPRDTTEPPKPRSPRHTR
ncbi:LacI family DNA-binding transcriptional regulator [Microlunatus soli]|uniref:Transcriptional regulator, LacI family n=1 Tax=Microlunatus soli TaxID=630515 RepID=A0A1H1U140_9ACTN|nr:LacI family DNA-binding transcriptional regulator [Microlunatus soli]SDS66178.1 transcriptional regulator, LacI family [Microlunatus soli]